MKHIFFLLSLLATKYPAMSMQLSNHFFWWSKDYVKEIIKVKFCKKSEIADYSLPHHDVWNTISFKGTRILHFFTLNHSSYQYNISVPYSKAEGDGSDIITLAPTCTSSDLGVAMLNRHALHQICDWWCKIGSWNNISSYMSSKKKC